MAKVAAFHSEKEAVHHDNDKCTEGNNIEAVNRKSGTGGKRLCNRCEELSKQGK